MENKKVLLRIENLKKYFPLKKKSVFQKQQYFVKANDGISLDIYEGETLGIVGESGCGKSTLGRTILQLNEQTAGSTTYYGRRIEDVAPQYVIDILKELPSSSRKYEDDLKRLNELSLKLEHSSNEQDRESLEKQYNDIEKKIGNFFCTTVKMFGALALYENLNEVSNVYLKWFLLASRIIKIEKTIDKIKIKSNANDKNVDIKASNNKIERLTVKLNALKIEQTKYEDRVNEIKESLKKHPKFDEYESQKDHGIDLAKLTSKEMRVLRKELQIIFQDPYSSLNPRLTVGNIIGEGLVAHELFKKGSEELQNYIMSTMDKCGLSSYMVHRYPHQFSGGQRQRIGIARALALNPQFIVCDEAVSALDVSIQSQIINLLKDLKDESNLTYLFITHDLSVVKYISDRICVMYLGNVVELASTKEIFENAKHPYTEALLSAIPTTDKDSKRELILLEGDIPSPINPPKGCKFNTRCKYAFEKCRCETPAFKEITSGHFVACHLRDEIKQ